MPNGKPGDHPLSDILHHGQSEYGDPVDHLVKQLSKHPGFSQHTDRISQILIEHSPLFHPQSMRPELVQAVTRKLQIIQKSLRNT